VTMTTFDPKAAAERVARETGWDLEAHASEHEWSGVGIGPVGQHRDSDALERSNFAVVYDDLRERFPGRVAVARFGHWAVGWVEEISFDLGAGGDVRAAVERWADALAGYPVADEMAYSALEHEEMAQWCATLRLDGHEDEHGIEYKLSPLVPVDELAERIASMIFERWSATRPDDAPGEPEIREAAVYEGLIVPDHEQVAAMLVEEREERDARDERLRTIAADVERGIADISELMDAIKRD
jgi:hypothetical protein